MYTVKEKEKEIRVEDVTTLKTMVNNGLLSVDSPVLDNSDGKWKTVEGVLADHQNSPMKTINDTWYYSEKGERKGPISPNVIKKMLQEKQMDEETLVWTEGFLDWKPLGQTELGRLSNEAPPLKGEDVNNSFVWVLALAPLFGIMLEGFVSELSGIAITSLWWITVAINIVLSYGDAGMLKKAGYDPENKIRGLAWLIPVYLWQRAKLLKQNKAYFIVWTLLFIFVLFGPFAAAQDKLVVEDMQNQIKIGLEEQADVDVVSVTLIKRSDNLYTGIATLKSGLSLSLEVTTDGNNFIWKVVK